MNRLLRWLARLLGVDAGPCACGAEATMNCRDCLEPVCDECMRFHRTEVEYGTQVMLSRLRRIKEDLDEVHRNRDLGETFREEDAPQSSP